VEPEWWGPAVAGASALVAAIWAVWTWRQQRETDRRQALERVDALYVNPFLFAAEDLQSRLYNILHKQGLIPLRSAYPDGLYADQLMHQVARYFAWEHVLLRFTRFGGDMEVVNRVQAVRRAFASDSGGLDPWCLFQPVQASLGQAVLVWRQGEHGFADTTSFLDLKKSLNGELRSLGLDQALTSLREARRIDDLPQRTIRRLAEVQIGVVDLLEYVEKTLSEERGTKFSVFGDRQRERSGVTT
jgi:hypothetical protein